MAPDPDKETVVKGSANGTKKGSKYEWAGAARYKVYEKKRRDTLNVKMESLAQLLPNFDQADILNRLRKPV